MLVTYPYDWLATLEMIGTIWLFFKIESLHYMLLYRKLENQVPITRNGKYLSDNVSFNQVYGSKTFRYDICVYFIKILLLCLISFLLCLWFIDFHIERISWSLLSTLDSWKLSYWKEYHVFMTIDVILKLK